MGMRKRGRAIVPCSRLGQFPSKRRANYKIGTEAGSAFPSTGYQFDWIVYKGSKLRMTEVKAELGKIKSKEWGSLPLGSHAAHGKVRCQRHSSLRRRLPLLRITSSSLGTTKEVC